MTKTLIGEPFKTLPVLSVTIGAIRVTPIDDGVPDKTPAELKVIPVGSGKNGDAVYVYGGVPPAVRRVVAGYGTPASPIGRSGGTVPSTGGDTICIGDTRIVNVWSAKFVGWASSVARNEKTNVPAVVGCPVKTVEPPGKSVKSSSLLNKPMPGGIEEPGVRLHV